MRETPTVKPAQWATYEVAIRNTSGQVTYPVSDELPSDGAVSAKTAIQKMLHVEALGWPGALLEFKDENGKPRIERSDDEDPPIYILKCKPKCWRLYFHVDTKNHRFVYLYARCKKERLRDPADATSARKIYSRRLSKGNGIAKFQFPNRGAI